MFFRGYNGVCVCVCAEPASPGMDSEVTMEVDSSDVNSESSRGMDDPEEAITPEDMDSPFMDGEKDEETVKTIR